MIKKAFFEALFVVFGVVLALAANEWRDTRLDRAQGERALDAILLELAANRSEVAEAASRHLSRLEALRSAEDEETGVDLRAFQGGFIRPANALSESAWDTASATGALAEIDFATVARLSGLYAAQDRYDAQIATYADIIYRELYDGGYAAITERPEGLGTLIGGLYYVETELVAAYDRVLGAPEGD